MQRYRLDWSTPSGHLLAIEPTPAEVAAHAPALATAYNDPHNAPLMGHTETISPAEVVENYATMSAEGARVFLLFHDGAFAGDADLRGITDRGAEFAFMIAATAAQGKGLGTRFAMLVHRFGFSQLALPHIYASIVPANVASRRVFEKLGYRLDDSAAARDFADDPGDLVMSIDRATFERQPLAEIAIAVR